VLRSADPTAEVFAAAGVSLDAARAEVGPAGETVPKSEHIPFTADAKHMLEMSLREAMALDDDFIACAHIALALLDEPGGQGVRIVRALGADVDELRDGIAALVVDEGAESDSGPRARQLLGSLPREPAGSAGPGPVELRSQRDLLADALRRYGRHEPGCPGESGPCGCGLAALLALTETWPESG
jgi:ATP-dependent Clp protease ATP-binding subunit ClpA